MRRQELASRFAPLVEEGLDASGANQLRVIGNLIQPRETAVLETRSPGVERMYLRKPMIPVRQWKSDRNFARIEVAIRGEHGWADRARKEEWKRIDIVVEHPSESRTRRPN